MMPGDRWRHRWLEHGWYPTASVFSEYLSQSYGYEGYKTVKFELIKQLDSPLVDLVAAVGAVEGFYENCEGF